MAERNNSHLLDGGDDPMGMTDNQYKGMLLDQLEDWQEVLDLAIKAGNTEIQEKAEKQIRKINEKLKFYGPTEHQFPEVSAVIKEG